MVGLTNNHLFLFLIYIPYLNDKVLVSTNLIGVNSDFWVFKFRIEADSDFKFLKKFRIGADSDFLIFKNFRIGADSDFELLKNFRIGADSDF